MWSLEKPTRLPVFTSSKTAAPVTKIVSRCPATSQVQANFQWKTKWISTHLNILPDALSRWGDQKYHKIFYDHCASLGIREPVQLHVLPEMFSF